jgi:hypothetical protein
MALDLASLTSLRATLNEYKEGFKTADIVQKPIQLPPGTYTGVITKAEWDSLQGANSSTSILRWQFKVLSANEVDNVVYVNSLTEKAEFVNFSDFTPTNNGQSNKAQDAVNRIKSTVYNAGIRTEQGFTVDDPTLLVDYQDENGNEVKGLLHTAIGNIVKFGVVHNPNPKDPNKPFINIYVNDCIGKESTSTIPNGQPSTAKDDGISF